jgi:tetratricopeptide (TPR) repeat protein
MKHPLSRHRDIWAFVLVSLLTVIVYYPGLSGDYMFDDRANLLQNRQLDLGTLDLESLQNAAFSSGSGALRRPVSMASFALNRYFFGIAPFSHKIVNLVIHLLTGAALFQLGRMLLRSYRQYRAPALSDRIVTWLPLVVAGLWLVHPLNLTTVLYIVQRMASLAALFTVCGLLFYITGRRRMLAGKHGLSYILTGLILCGSLAILSKENGILLPLYMLVLELALFRFRAGDGRLDTTISGFFLLVVAIPAVVATTYLAAHADAYLNYAGRDFNLQERLLTQGRVLLFYLQMIVMPSIQQLGLYHDDIPLSHGLLNPPATLYSFMALAGMLLSALALLGKRPLVSLGILWFFAGHVLESTVIPLEMAHEHRNYLADYGILLALASAIAQAPLRRARPLLNTALPALFLVMFSYTTWLRSEQWSDNINQAVYEARHHPESFRSVFAAGRIHARLALQGNAESETRAFELLERARTLDKTGIMSDVTLIKLSFLTGRPVDPERYESIMHKLANYPLSTSDISSLKVLAECTNDTCGIPDATVDAIFQEALHTENPEILTIYGFYRINKRADFSGGLTLFEHALELDPRESQRWKNLINLLTVMQRFEDAEHTLEQFRLANTHQNSASDYRILKQDIDSVREQYRKAEHPDETGNS